MLKRLLSTLLLCVLFVPAAVAQTGTVAGTVIEAESGEPLPGVNVVLQELDRGAATNTEGGYRISGIPVGTYTLRVSFVGFQPYETEITIEADEVVTLEPIELEEGAVGLDEVVVTGYGTEQTVGDLTGSVANLDSEGIQDVPVQSTEGLLQGRVAGVQVSATSGNPGSGFSIDIRGQGSINAGNRPLYVVDGVQMSFDQNFYLTDRSPLNAIQPSDIESIQVLKDAAAAAIYGAQAANGVVLIETKSGRAGQTRVSVDFEGGVRFQSERWDLMDREEWLQFQIDAFGESTTRNGILTAFGYDADTEFSELRDFQWQDWLFDPGPHRRVGFSASGGDQNTNYFLSGSWSKTGGALVANAVNYEQYSVRANLGQQFTPKLDTDLKLSLSNQQNNGVCQDGFFINCPFYQAIGEEPPISHPYLEDGQYNPNTEQSPTTNPAVTLNEESRTLTVTQFVGNLSPSYQITPWLTAEASAGLDWQIAKENDYGTPTVAPANGGELFRGHNWITNMTLNATLNGSQTFGGVHEVSVLLGSEYRRRWEDDDGFGVIGFNNNLLRVANAAAEASGVPGGFNDEFRQLSYFARGNYNYDERYIFTLTGRYDGSSRFGDLRRWAFFPSVSGAWRISEEQFFNADFVDNLKVRLSYGETGNSQIGDYAARGLYSLADSYSGQPSIRPDQLANPRLTWEEKRSVNVGVDWSLWSSRLTGSLNLYRETSDNLLLDRPLPVSSGYGEFTQNIGQVQNEGIELELQTVNIQTEDFRWSTDFNMSIRQNEVKELTPGTEELASDFTPIAVGHSLQAYKVPLWAGVNPADGRPLYYDADGNLTYNPDAADEQFFDGAEEDVVGGFGTRVTYKGLSLRAFFDYSYGKHVYQNTLSSYTAAFGENVWGKLRNRWREPGDVAPWPRSTPFGSFDTAQDPGGLSNYWLFRVNYIRLKNVTLSYSLPSNLANQIGLRSARIYVTGLNLLDWQSVPGIEPEASGTLEEGDYPVEQQLNVGLQLQI
jgi:TonB-linked SusC/RagA family outer membrane protein